MTNNSIVKADEKPIAEWGDREEVAGIAKRIKTMLPGGDKLSDQQAYAAAQYARLSGLDPFAKGFYAMPGGGIHRHYAILVNWAQGKAPYTDRYLPLTAEEREVEGLPEDTIAWKCYIIRDDRAHILGMYLKAGLALDDALDLVATRGIGRVSKKDRIGKEGKAVDPPKGWTWEKVAQKRALTDALSLSHGQPTAQEIRAISERMPAHPDERAARYEDAVTRVAEASRGLTTGEHRERLASNVEILRGGEIDPIELYEPAETTDETDFIKGVLERIPYYNHARHVKNTLKKLDLVFDPDNTEMLFDELARYASAKADEAAAG